MKNLPKVFLFFLAVAAALSTSAFAQGRGTVRIVVPFAAGTPLDVIARDIAQRLPLAKGESVIVDNKPGAGGILGAAEAAKSTSKSSTLLVTTHNTLVISPHLYANAGYNPLKDFAPIGLVGTGGYMLVAHPDAGAKSLDEYLALARKNPGKVPYASYGVGSGPHLCAELLQAKAKVQLLHVPYKAGSINDVVGGQIDFSFEPPATAAQYISTGRLIPLGFTSPERPQVLPNAPLIQDKVPGYDCRSWVGVFAPAGMPAAEVVKLSSQLQAIVGDEAFRARLRVSGIEPTSSTSEEFSRIVAQDYARWGELIRTNNIKLD